MRQSPQISLKKWRDARKRREQEYEARERALEEQFQKKATELEERAKTRQEEHDQQLADLNARSKELDDRAAKHARRQHYKDIKEKFDTWSEEFHLTKGTSGLRWHVYVPTLVLMVLFAGLAGYFLFQSFSSENATQLVAAITAKITFTLLFASTAFFLIRWNNQWFQRHANEEFRLKRMELDVDRASWFVEMAFEWKDEKGEPIPLDLMQRLTEGLFSDGQSDHTVEPIDSLAQALLGAAKFKVKLGDGTEVEYDRKGVRELLQAKP